MFSVEAFAAASSSGTETEGMGEVWKGVLICWTHCRRVMKKKEIGTILPTVLLRRFRDRGVLIKAYRVGFHHHIPLQN